MCAESKRTIPKIIAVDLFCGAGGLTKGLLDAKIRVKLGIDVDPAFKETYERNNKGTTFWDRRIEDVSGDDISAFLKVQKNQKLMLAACAPCQPFSRQNKKSVLRGYDDERKDLLLEVVRIMKEMPRKPDYIFIENVPGLEDVSHSVGAKFQKYLRAAGYSIAADVKNATNYGVPQRRKRFIIIGVRGNRKLDLPEETHGKEKIAYVTVRSAFTTPARLPTLRAGQKSAKVPNHKTRKLAPINLERLMEIPKDGGSRAALSKHLVNKGHEKVTGHTDTYGRMAWDKPAPTLTCRCVSFSNGRFGHPTQNRAISVREAARLQTFPDSYVFYGTGIDSEAKQVGNAVPPLFAKHFGEHFQRILREGYGVGH